MGKIFGKFLRGFMQTSDTLNMVQYFFQIKKERIRWLLGGGVQG